MSSASTVQARMPARVYDRTREDVPPRPAEPPRSLRRAARETSRAPLAPPAGLFLPLLGHVDEPLLAALGRLARAHVGAVGLHLPGAVAGRELRIDDLAELLAECGLLDRRHHLHPALQVPLHAVGGPDEPLFVAGVPEVVDAPMLEEPADDADHPHGVREPGNARAQ